MRSVLQGPDGAPRPDKRKRKVNRTRPRDPNRRTWNEILVRLQAEIDQSEAHVIATRDAYIAAEVEIRRLQEKRHSIQALMAQENAEPHDYPHDPATSS